MLSDEEHLDNLIRHIELVRNATILLGKRLMKKGRKEFGRLLIAKGFEHDVDKFYGINWDYLHAGSDTDKHNLELAIKNHTHANQHHPEYWGGIENMPELAVAEMVCDWYARSKEFSTSLRDWITNSAIEKFKIDIDGEVYKWINNFVSLILIDNFVK